VCYNCGVKKASTTICGLDEAGRGALAGPLVAAAVILKCSRNKISRRSGFSLRDGKMLTAKQRRTIYTVLKRLKTSVAVEIISARSINNHGIGWANREIFRRLIKKIEADRYIVDGTIKIGRIAGKKHVQSIVDADATIPEVICAGIVAKVERDQLMRKLHRQFPKYGWHRNAGYGTKKHIAAIELYAMTRYHRAVFVTTAMRNKILYTGN
jgi:ribonuclease HII